MSEIDLSKAQVDNEAKIIHHFKDLEETPEQLAAELYRAIQAKNEAEKTEKRIKEYFKEKYGQGDHMVGGFLVGLSPSEGRRSVKIDTFEKYILGLVGKDGLEEARKACISKGDDALRVSVKKIQQSSGDPVGDGSAGEGL